jgi:hypothetical protein
MRFVLHLDISSRVDVNGRSVVRRKRHAEDDPILLALDGHGVTRDHILTLQARLTRPG